jgi:hypothetical protein
VPRTRGADPRGSRARVQSQSARARGQGNAWVTQAGAAWLLGSSVVMRGRSGARQGERARSGFGAGGRRESWPGGKGEAWAVTPPCRGVRTAALARVEAARERLEDEGKAEKNPLVSG